MNGTVWKYLPIGLILALIAGGVGYGALRAQVNENSKDVNRNREGIVRVLSKTIRIELNQAKQEAKAEERHVQTVKELQQIQQLIRQQR